MDGYEATRIVFSRIQNLDPENASKIMGLLLIQDHGEKEMIRLAFGPESLVQSVIVKARKELGLNSPTTTTQQNLSSASPNSPSTLFSRQNSLSSSSSHTSRLGFTNPPSITIPNPSWSAVSELSPNGSSSLNPASLPFYGNGAGVGDVGGDLIDELQIQDQLSFLNDNTPSLIGPKNTDLSYPQLDSLPSPTGVISGGGDSMLFPSYWNDSVHRRSCSFNDVLGSEDINPGLGWRPCHYYARGYCKNGSSCSFVHGGLGGESDCNAFMVGSPNNSNKMEMMEQCHELLRSKSLQHHQQRFAAASQLLSSYPYSPKCMNFLVQQQQTESQRAAAAAAALMMGEDMLKFGRARFDRNDLVNPASRQIYLTFPADSTFREEDVSNYFSIYGPVQDVRIPYQQKRMFGFVTFVYPETVKIILAKGNPHFVCDARVLVKPYKEKGKVDKKQHQQGDRGDFSPCGTPTGLESRDPSDIPFGVRMFCNNQDMLWRRKIEEQNDLQKALELQNRRLMNLQLLDVKKHHHQRAFSTGSLIASPTHSPSYFNQSMPFPSFHSSPEVPQENCSSPLPVISLSAPPEKQMANAGPENECTNNEENGSGKEISNVEGNDLKESLEHNLPDSPFASPTEGTRKYYPFANSTNDAEKDATVTTPSSANNTSTTSVATPTTSSQDMASCNFNCQRPGLSSSHGAIGMLASTTTGPNYPVGI